MTKQSPDFKLPRQIISPMEETYFVMATSRVSLTASAVAGRAVHIKIHPRPRNISESRQVLRVLERYGEVVMYKHLKVYDFISSASDRIVSSTQSNPMTSLIRDAKSCSTADR